MDQMHFQWLNGEPVVFTRWDEKEPSNAAAGGIREDCVSIRQVRAMKHTARATNKQLLPNANNLFCSDANFSPSDSNRIDSITNSLRKAHRCSVLMHSHQ